MGFTLGFVVVVVPAGLLSTSMMSVMLLVFLGLEAAVGLAESICMVLLLEECLVGVSSSSS